ncbi:transposase, MuDR, MULE transposase domain protein [Tanacetum coccineum]
MLDKHLYDSWKSIMEQYMLNIEHRRMILESVEHIPLIWTSRLKENGGDLTRNMFNCLLLRKFKLIVISKQLISFFKVYQLMSTHSLIIIEIKGGFPLLGKNSTTNARYLIDKEGKEIDSGLAVLVFKQGDDPIDVINKMMSFLSTVITSRFPYTNNQLRNSSNPRQQATIHDGRVTVQPLQGRPNSYATGTLGTKANTSGTRGRILGQQRVVKCFNCQKEGHMARQCIEPKMKRDATWFRDKVLLVEAQGNGKVLNEEELEFLVDPGY